MYSVKPLGINTKDDDWNVPDGTLQESINLQWRDNSLRPLPNRIVSDIATTGYKNIIFHKVSDENKINVLGFGDDISPTFLAFDLAGGLTGSPGAYDNVLIWFGTIEDGVFSTVPLRYFAVQKTPGMSFTVLNGLLYFMGDGSNSSEQYYTRLQYNESNEAYEVKDMYAWKDLIPYLPKQENVEITFPSMANKVITPVGVILFRYALVLKTGEVVLPTPMYISKLYAVNQSDSTISIGDSVENVHSVIPLNLDFNDTTILLDEISAINVYASTPVYGDTILNISGSFGHSMGWEEMKGGAEKRAEEPFYLVKTIEPTAIPSEEKLVLFVGNTPISFDITDTEFSTVNINTIAAGEILPADNFTYHELYGDLTSKNGRLIVSSPTTILSGGHIRALAVNDPGIDPASKQGYIIDTEDGKILGTPTPIDKTITVVITTVLGIHVSAKVSYRGILSYPDIRATKTGATEDLTSVIYVQDTRKNSSHNLATAFDFNMTLTDVYPVPVADTMNFNYDVEVYYNNIINVLSQSTSGSANKYSSENRTQFSAAGEFSVWPAINSYRIGEGKIMKVGTNSVDPANADIVSPLIIGTSDGVYTANFDPTGANLISSITKTKNTPYLSSEVLQVDGAIVFVSDKGLMAINNGTVVNLTQDFFPDQGNGNFPVNETVLPGYDTLTNDFFGGANPYVLDDIVTYMRGALFAFDGRRDMIWCSNTDYNFSLLFDTKTKTWAMSTLVFSHAAEYYALTTASIGDVYTRFMVKSTISNNMLVLDGEDLNTEVFYHLLTRPIKFSPVSNPSKDADRYKQVERMFSRCVLLRDTSDGYFSFGLWGKQDINKQKKAIPMAIKSDDRAITYPNDVRQDIPINNRKGKYKTVTILQSGKALPGSSINEFDFDVMLVDNARKR